MTETTLLKFSSGNRKLKALQKHLGVKVYGFDLPAGWTCPAADICKSQADKITGKITDGKNCQFRCYAASCEARSTNARKAHWNNFDLLKSLSTDDMVKLITTSLPENAGVIRIHASGDFFTKQYFNAWVRVAESHPEIKFFGYTKVIQYVNSPKPENFKLVYSFGGKLDSKLSDEPTCYVVTDQSQADKMGVPVSCSENDWDDFHMIMDGKTFAITIHGTQPAGSQDRFTGIDPLESTYGVNSVQKLSQCHR